jgi:hypothetical protein
MTAYGTATFRALPFFFFPIQELLYSLFLYIVEVFNHAHPVKSTVAFIKMGEIFTGIVCTFMTILDLIIQNKLALFLNESAFFIPRPATGTVRDSDSFFFNIIPESQVTGAYPAVHSTGGNQLFSHFLFSLVACITISNQVGKLYGIYSNPRVLLYT